MLTPEQLDRVSDRVTALYSGLEHDLLVEIARLIGDSDYNMASLDWAQYVYTTLFSSQQELIRRLAIFTRMTEEEVRRAFVAAGVQSVEQDKTIYKKAYDAGLVASLPKPLLQSPVLLPLLEAGLKQTQGDLLNITNSIAANYSTTLREALDSAYTQVTSGVFSYEVAIRRAVEELQRKGIGMVEYPSGVRNRVDTVVRRAVLTGVNITTSKISDKQMDDFGATTVEVTAHEGARNKGEGYVNHESWQGGWYSYKGRNPDYPSFEDVCGVGKGGGIHGWNCRHSYFPVFPGISVPLYKDFKPSDKKFVINGKEYDYYGATQQQRYIERRLKHWKERRDMMKAAGLPNPDERAKVAYWNGRMDELLEVTGFKRRYGSERSLVTKD